MNSASHSAMKNMLTIVGFDTIKCKGDDSSVEFHVPPRPASKNRRAKNLLTQVAPPSARERRGKAVCMRAW